jgi:hypothetical protein
MSPSGWTKSSSGLFLPSSYRSEPEGKDGGDGSGPRPRKAVGAVRVLQSPTLWTASSAVGQMAAAIVATVALMIALSANAEQESLKQLDNARRVAFWSLDAQLPNTARYRVENRSATPLWPVRLARFRTDESSTAVHYHDLGRVDPCSAADVTVPSLGGRVGIMLYFSESYRWWIAAGAGAVRIDTKQQTNIVDTAAPLGVHRAPLGTCG